MAHEMDNNAPLGGMNSDDEFRSVPKGDFLSAKNIRVAINQTNKGGALLNIKGNTLITKYCLPYNNNVWPTGRNKVIGSVEDTKYNTVIFFVWNSESKHQILRYYRDVTSPLNSYGEVRQVIQYDFGWTKRTKINSANIVYGVTETGGEDELTGDLLYWSDKTPRKINLTKAEVCTKLKCWDLYLPVTIEGSIANTTTYTFKNFGGTTIFSKTVDTSTLVTEQKSVKYIPNSGLLGDREILILDANLDLSGVTEITIVSSNPAYNYTYTVLAWMYQDFTNTTIFKVDSFPAPDYYEEAVTLQWNVPEAEQRNHILGNIADAFNDDATSPVTAEFCDCHLEFCEKTVGRVLTIESDEDANIISPSNWYGATLIDRFFDRCKWQPLNAPRGTFEKDTNYEPNYVQRKVFQFRLEYDYDDLERSALGVWSQIPINNLGCDGTSDTSYNYIDVDFNDTLIPVATTLVLLKRIRLIARELNTGNDRAVISLEPCDFLDYTDGAWYCHFKFYNDIISSPIDAATAAKLFDNVPLESNDERYVKNRLVEGGILEGYDAPECVKAKAQIEFSENRNKPFRKITGKIKIISFGLQDDMVSIPYGTFFQLFPNNYNKYPFWEHPTRPDINYNIRRGGIFKYVTNADSKPFYGGAAFGSGSGSDYGFSIEVGDGSNVDGILNQTTYEAGFPVYAAGTPYFTISRQINTGLPQDPDGSLDISTQAKIDAIGDWLYEGNDLYSTFELLVPDDATYVIRVASHFCSFNNESGGGFYYNLSSGQMYQKTSTNVWAVLDSNGVQQSEKEIRVEVSGSDVDCGSFLVMDLYLPTGNMLASQGSPTTGIMWYPYEFYLYDSNNGTVVNSNPNDESFTGVPVEKTLVNISPLSQVIPIDTTLGNSPNMWNSVAATDHNGYFFGISDYFYYLMKFQAYQVGSEKICDTQTFFLGALGKLITKDFEVLSLTSFASPRAFGVIATTLNSARQNCSTRVQGFLKTSTGTPLREAIAIYESGSVDETDSTGFYSIIAWGDMITVNLPVFSTGAAMIQNDNRIVDDLIFELSLACQPDYINGQVHSPVEIDPFGANATDTPPPYSPTAPKDIPDFIINEGNDPTQKALKRGGNYTYAGRGYDSAGRLCSCFFLSEIYIPFITEDIGKYGIEDFSGGVYPTPYYAYGKPSLKIVLDATTVFPSWMSYFQLMRMKNSIYGRYLQWVANQVTYVSALATDNTPEILTSFQNGDATAIKISIKNIIDYSAQNNDSQVGYQYQAGDRLRLIADRNIEYIDGLNDFEVTSYDSTTQEVIIKPEGFSQEIKSGTLFEIFNPKSVATDDSQIFYEVGEVIKVTNGIPETYSLTLTNGDTYWRGRLITVNDDATKFAAAYPVVIEDASVSDFYPSEAQDIGRIGIIDPAFKQVYAPTKVRCSNVFLPSTAVNGLSSFEELNQKEFDRSNGQIERLLVLNNTIIAVTSQREISNYIEVVSFQQADVGDGVLAIANQYFGTEYPHAKRLGTDHPSSVLINDGQAFGFQGKRGDAWKYQGDGEQTISNNKMRQYFEGLEQSGVSDAIAVYHRFSDEYILTIWRKYQFHGTVSSIGGITAGINIGVVFDTVNIPVVNEDVTVQYLTGAANNIWTDVDGEVTSANLPVDGGVVNINVLGVNLTIGQQVNIIYSRPETVVFFNGDIEGSKDRWIRFDSRVPERWEQLGSGIVSFKDGKVWIEDTNPIYNNFFGLQYETEIAPVFSDNPLLMKVWNSLWLAQRQDNKRCNWRSDLITNELWQQSRLKAANWVNREGDWYIDFKRDITDSSVANPIVSGRMLRSKALAVYMQNNYTGEITLYNWRANTTNSPRTEK